MTDITIFCHKCKGSNTKTEEGSYDEASLAVLANAGISPGDPRNYTKADVDSIITCLDCGYKVISVTLNIFRP